MNIKAEIKKLNDKIETQYNRLLAAEAEGNNVEMTRHQFMINVYKAEIEALKSTKPFILGSI